MILIPKIYSNLHSMKNIPIYQLFYQSKGSILFLLTGYYLVSSNNYSKVITVALIEIKQVLPMSD